MLLGAQLAFLPSEIAAPALAAAISGTRIARPAISADLIV